MKQLIALAAVGLCGSIILRDIVLFVLFGHAFVGLVIFHYVVMLITALIIGEFPDD